MRVPTWARDVLAWMAEHPTEPFRTVQSGAAAVIALRVAGSIHVMRVDVIAELYMVDRTAKEGSDG